MKATYDKAWLSIEDQLRKLQSAGLVVEDPESAFEFLRHLNYYRFSGYGLAFEKARHQFAPGTTFERIRQAYEFDRALRDLVYESMEAIELDIRTTVAYTFGETYRALGHTDPKNFYQATKQTAGTSKGPGFDHKQWHSSLQAETRRSSERFVQHFKAKYTEYPDLPIWVATEIMSFGTLSRMIEGMHKPDLKRVSSRYGLQPLNFVSCLHHLVYVRNLCAHHARLWDREWSIKPDLPPGKSWKPPNLPGNNRLYASLLLQRKFLAGCTAEQDFSAAWRDRVQDLIETSPPQCSRPLHLMGMSPDWAQHPVWKEGAS